jgi:UDP-N-acetylmuramate dehydrogenase
MSYFCKKNLILKKNISMKGQQTTDNRQQTLSNDIAKNQHSLSESNTMGFDITAKRYYEINSLLDIEKIVEEDIFNHDNTLILGGGSNILFQNEYFDGTVIHSNLKGITISPDDEDSQQLNS